MKKKNMLSNAIAPLSTSGEGLGVRAAILILSFLFTFPSFSQPQKITGLVQAPDLQPLAGATIRTLPSGTSAQSGQQGAFSILPASTDTALQVSFIGYKTQTIVLPAASYTVILQPGTASLENVTVSTGYDKRSKLSTTGSFSVIGNDLLTRQLTTSVLAGLDGIAASVQFEKRPVSNPFLSIRGRSTIMGNSKPLIVLDGFPYEGDLDNLNPNNIESVTILKDAAASAVWGVRASNGVIVITSKKGRYNQQAKIDVSSTYTIGQEPGLFAQPLISSSDYIDVEQFLFSKGFYNAMESSVSKPVLSPVVELLIKKRDGLLTAPQAQQQIDALRNYDLRGDLLKYLYQQSTRQQHSLNIRGGASKMFYAFSAGFDKNISALNDQYNRIVLRSDNGFTPAKGLEITAGITYTQTTDIAGRPAPNSTMLSAASGKQLYRYTRLADDNGNALPVFKDYRSTFIETAPSKGLLNWQFVPLDEFNLVDKKTRQQDVLLNTGVRYNFIQAFTAELQYQYERAAYDTRNYQSPLTYFVRNEINRFTQFNTAGNIIGRPVPLGGIVDNTNSYLNAYTLRAQLRYDKNWQQHRLNILLGAEQRESATSDRGYRVYGYDDNVLTTTAVNFDSAYRLYPNQASTSKITNGISLSDITNRFRSTYATVNYNYKDRYLLSASLRKDGSNLFGVNANQKFVPLWSTGAAWIISKEHFFAMPALPFLKLRLSYGYNGNIDNTLSAYTVVRYGSSSLYSLPVATLNAPANPDLRWEKVRMINLGIDFAFKNDIISGSIDLWQKNGKDLIGLGPLDPTTGVLPPSVNPVFSFKGNTADMKGRGLDLELQTRNLDGKFQWTTNILFSYAYSWVTRYAYEATTTSTYLGSLGINPVIGKPVYSLYSYRWGGLDSTGNPQGFVDGKLSKDYIKLVISAKPADLVYHGNAVAPYFGSIRNNFSFAGFTLSANLTWRFGHWFRRNSLSYAALFNNNLGHGDFADRWQKPGDENFTGIPAMIYPLNSNRESFYLNSEATVQKGDHIRLADLRLDYDLYKTKTRWLPFSQVKLYLYASNLGFIWKASKTATDPDTQSEIPLPKQFSFGLKANL
jgi:TonB-dependent starch-binding outer membrane protein SusC